VVPVELKRSIADFACQFQGYDQHDASELLMVRQQVNSRKRISREPANRLTCVHVECYLWFFIFLILFSDFFFVWGGGGRGVHLETTE